MSDDVTQMLDELSKMIAADRKRYEAEIERLSSERDVYSNEITGKLMPEIERLRGLLREADTALSLMPLPTRKFGDLRRRVREALGDVPES